MDLNGEGGAPGDLGRDDGGAGPAEWLIHGLPWRRVVLDRPAHALDRLLGAVAMTIVIARVNRPECRLLAVPAPIRAGRPPHRVPAGFVLPMIVASAERETVLGPNDLGAHLEAGGLKGLLDLARMPTSMPDICNRARKQRPGLPPTGAIVVRYLAELAGVEIDAGTFPPRRIVIHAVGRIGNHQLRLDPGQQPLGSFRGRAVTAKEVMRAKDPKIAGSRDRVARQVWHGVWIGQPFCELRG